MQFDTWDISTWVVISQEARGLDPKDWMVPSGDVQRPGQAHWWLFKPVKTAGYRRFDDASERIAAALASLLDLPAAQVELARNQSEEGIISGNVTPNGWSLESGDTLLSEFDGYLSCAGEKRPKDRVGHTLENIARVLVGCSGAPNSSTSGWEAMEVFAGYLVFDAWIANTDRHAVNWGVLTRDEDGQRALAPTFDHGSALASGTQDERLALTTADDFAARGYAGRFEGGRRRPLVELALSAVEQAGSRAETWLDRLASVRTEDWEDILSGLPNLSEVRRTFLSNVLQINRRRLTS